MFCGKKITTQEDSNVALCSGKDYSDISKVCYLRCKKTVGSLKVKVNLSQGSGGPGRDYHHDSLLGIFTFKLSFVVSLLSVSEVLRPTMQAFPELVRYSMGPLFCLQ